MGISLLELPIRTNNFTALRRDVESRILFYLEITPAAGQMFLYPSNLGIPV